MRRARGTVNPVLLLLGVLLCAFALWWNAEGFAITARWDRTLALLVCGGLLAWVSYTPPAPRHRADGDDAPSRHRR